MAEIKEKEEPEFLNLKSDIALRKELATLKFENPSDERSVELILKQKALSKSQRFWLTSLVRREGKTFVADPKTKDKNLNSNKQKT